MHVDDDKSRADNFFIMRIAIRAELAETKAEFRQHRAELTAAIARLDHDIKAAVSELRAEIRAMATKAENDLREFAARVENQLGEMRADHVRLRNEVGDNYRTLNARIDSERHHTGRDNTCANRSFLRRNGRSSR